MSLLATLSVPNDGVAVATRTAPRQLCQTDADYPGSALSSTPGSAIKRITAGVKACRWSYRQVRAGDRPSPSCTHQCRTKNSAPGTAPQVVSKDDWPVQNRYGGSIRRSTTSSTRPSGCRTARVPVGARFEKLLRVPDGKTRFLTPKCDERGVCREEDEVFSFGHAQQQAVERITVRLRDFHAGQDVFVGYREDGCSC